MGIGAFAFRLLLQQQHLADWIVLSGTVAAGVVLYGLVISAMRPAALGDLRAVIVPQGR
jgi:hypothetical protein